METTQPKGTKVSAPVVNASLGEQFGTHFDWLGIGGWRPVDTLAARDAIPVTDRLESRYSSGRRRRWMRVFVWQDSVKQEYELAISDADWNAAPTDKAKIALLADNTRWQLVRSSAGGRGGALQWVPGPQTEGDLVYDAGFVYRVKQNITNSQVAPGNNPQYYQLLGPATGGGGAGGAAWTEDTASSVTLVLGPNLPLAVEEYCIMLVPIDNAPSSGAQVFSEAFVPQFV